MSSGALVALNATGTSALKDVGILVAMKATLDSNVIPTIYRISVALKALVDRNVNSQL